MLDLLNKISKAPETIDAPGFAYSIGVADHTIYRMLQKPGAPKPVEFKKVYRMGPAKAFYRVDDLRAFRRKCKEKHGNSNTRAVPR
jgi:predicted DNA-binding transcriptional regulator AlpA